MEEFGTAFVLTKPVCESGHHEENYVEEEITQSL
jgi:hypothetical protein